MDARNLIVTPQANQQFGDLVVWEPTAQCDVVDRRQRKAAIIVRAALHDRQ
jgi:hypothetical protein